MLAVFFIALGLTFSPLRAQAASPVNHAQKLLGVYEAVSETPFFYSKNEVDQYGAKAEELHGNDRIYALWRVLYIYKNSRNEAKLKDWNARISRLALKDGDSNLDLLTRLMWQTYENETHSYSDISDGEWNTYISATNSALRNISGIEYERQLQSRRQWAEAIDLGEKLALRLAGEGVEAKAALGIARQSLAYSLLKVGDYDGYAQNMLVVAQLSKDNSFFIQKMDFLYDLTYFAAQDNDIENATKLQAMYAGYVNKYQAHDLMGWNELLCAIVDDKKDNQQGVIDCLKNSDVSKGIVNDGYDVRKLALLTTGYAKSGNSDKAEYYLSKLRALPENLYETDQLFESYVQAQLLANKGEIKEAFEQLDQWGRETNKNAERRRIAAIQDMYKALRKELDSKTAEARLLNQQVQLRNWLLATAGAVVLLLIALGVGAALWVVRMRRMQWRLKEASDHAEAANAAKSRFLAVMSHELRTPLNGVLGMAQALQRDKLTDDQRAKVDTLAESGETLLMLLNDVLDMSRIEAGKVELSPTPASMKDMIERVFNTFAPTIGEKPVALRYDIDATMPPILSFDMLRVYQCLSNLVSNAVKFTNEGVIRVVASAEKHLDKPGYTVRLEVRDTGIGISKASLSKLFEAYSQADASTARKYGGSGLGLSITQRLTELMGGNVSVTSEEGAGSVFVMTFEAGEVETPAEEATEIAPEDMLPHGVRILLVDDHPVNRKVARLFLEPFGFDITEAVDGQEALDAGMEDYDLVLMDVNMPRLGGIDATRQFRATEEPGKHVPIIALTADALPEQIEACLAAGMDAHVSKPIVMDKLIDTVVSLLGEDVLQAAQSA